MSGLQLSVYICIGFIGLAFNIYLSTKTAISLLQRFKLKDISAVTAWQLLLLLIIAQMILVCLVLGYAGILNFGTITISHLSLFLITWFNHRRVEKTPGTNTRNELFILIFKSPFSRAKEYFCSREHHTIYKSAVIIVGVIMTMMVLVNLLTEPLNYDSHTYRLSRISYWLQDSSIRHFETSEERMNYTPFNADLVMLWLTSFSPIGYPFVKFPQFFGGLLCLLAVYGFCQSLNISKPLSLLALLLVMSMPHLAIQMISSQTDLFTAGCMNSGLYFLFIGIKNHRPFYLVPAWLGIALAIGAKGTVFYWIFGLAIAFILWVWTYRISWKFLTLTILAAFVFIGIFGSPRYLENTIHYGNPLAPVIDIEKRHPSTEAPRYKVATLNALSYLTENLESHSNPLIPDFILSAAADAFYKIYPDVSIDYEGYEQKAAVKRFLSFQTFESDRATPGMLSCILFILGGIYASFRLIFKRDQSALHIFTLFMAVLGFLLFFCLIAKWSPFKHRYFVLFSPFMAIVGVYPFTLLGARYCKWLIGLLSLNLIIFSYSLFFLNTHSSFKNIFVPSEIITAINLREINGMLNQVSDQGDHIAVARRNDVLLSPLFRNGRNQTVRFFQPKVIASDYDSPREFLMDTGFDVLISEPRLFHNRNGNIFSYSYINFFRGPSQNWVVGYRLLKKDEQPNGFIEFYEKRESEDGPVRHYTFSIQNNLQHVVPFYVGNTFKKEVAVEISSAFVDDKIILKPGAENKIEINSEINDTIDFRVKLDHETIKNSYQRAFFIPLL